MPQLLPGVAQVAIQGGMYVARLIRRRVNGERPAKPFWYWDKGNMAIVGRTFAVADLKHVRFAGFTAWLLWVGIHISGRSHSSRSDVGYGFFHSPRRITHADPGRQTQPA